jgi:hypothetical protein
MAMLGLQARVSTSVLAMQELSLYYLPLDKGKDRQEELHGLAIPEFDYDQDTGTVC